MNRRQVLVGGGATAAFGVLVGVSRPAAGAAVVLGAGPRFGSTLDAYASTLVPGPIDDPTGAPGAVEAQGVQVLLAQLPEVAPVVATDVEAAALTKHLQPFTWLTYEQREALLVDAFADPMRSPSHLIAFALVAGAFYGDMANHVGGAYLGLPGPSGGYLDRYTDRTGHGQPEAAAVPP